jgi:hypothetical protein
MTVVLVIDSVDECPVDIQPFFLSAISAGVPLLPSTVKVYFTSRPRVEMHQCLETLELLKFTVTVGVGMDDGDIEYCLQHELEGISKAMGLDKSWLASQIKRDASALASKAGGLFSGPGSCPRCSLIKLNLVMWLDAFWMSKHRGPRGPRNTQALIYPFS